MQEDILWNKNGGSATVIVKDWMKLDCVMLLSIIPIIGTIAAIIIYIVLAFHQNTAASIKSRIQANFIWLVIFLIISIIVAIIFAVIMLLGMAN
ncbi:MAG: hypothetical protein E7263_12020 [Lachnospiraceae bacterium]|nr:hypothetical protein [Lachnospiraceae bacterium]